VWRGRNERRVLCIWGWKSCCFGEAVVFSKLDATLSSAGAARLSKRLRHAPAEAVNCNLIMIDFFSASCGFNCISCIITRTRYHTRWLRFTGVDVLHTIPPPVRSCKQASLSPAIFILAFFTT
jgi:hypothetical protein